MAGCAVEYGPWGRVYDLFRRWQRNGTWQRILTRLQSLADAAGAIMWDLSVDSTVCRARQHAAGARKWGDLQKEPPGGVFTEPVDHGLGRSRGGFTTKLHLAVERGQKPLSIVITAGQRGDSPQFEPVLAKVRVPRIGPVRPRIRPDRVRADKAYASRKNRDYLRRRRIRCTIPDKADQARNRQARLPRRPTAALRPGRLPPAPRGRVRDQPPQTPPGGGHKTRQTFRPLRGHRHDRRHQRVALILLAKLGQREIRYHRRQQGI
ncbi:hypothetical protein GCM10019017_23510 [Streptomyces showdoensis]